MQVFISSRQVNNVLIQNLDKKTIFESIKRVEFLSYSVS